MVLAPDVARQQVVERRDGRTPVELPGHLQPLGVLVEHRVDDVDERLVAVEQPVPSGEQVALEPPLAQVLRQDLHHPTVGRQVVVVRHGLGHPGAVGRLEHRRQPVGCGLVGTGDAERVRVAAHDVAQPHAEDAGGLAAAGVRGGDVDGVVRGSRAGRGHGAADRRWRTGLAPIRRSPSGARRAISARSRPSVEQLLGPVAAHPRLELPQVVGVLGQPRQRDLVGSVRALDLLAVHHRGAGPALRGAEHDHRPAGPLAARRGPAAGGRLDGGDLVERGVQRVGQCPVDVLGVVALDQVDRVAVAVEQCRQLVVGDAGQHRGVGDLVAVEVEDRQHGPVDARVEELVRVPAGGQRPGLGLAVADDAHGDEVGVVERRPVGVGQA